MNSILDQTIDSTAGNNAVTAEIQGIRMSPPSSSNFSLNMSVQVIPATANVNFEIDIESAVPDATGKLNWGGWKTLTGTGNTMFLESISMYAFYRVRITTNNTKVRVLACA